MESMGRRGIQIIVVCAVLTTLASGKVYDRCELARELLDVHEIPEHQVATWVCLARHESEYNTSALNPGSGDHGLFQISELYWCSPHGYACGVPCRDLRDDDIEDDVICARRIHREHKRLSGDGFNAWVVYNAYCKDQYYVQSLVEDCFTAETRLMKNKVSMIPTTATPKPTTRWTTTSKPTTRWTTSPKSTIKYYQTTTSRIWTTQKKTTKYTTKRPTTFQYKYSKPTTATSSKQQDYTYSIRKTGFVFTRTSLQ
ncbi:PREDICTED: lysozyme C-like [Nicrophorus vespilloides]|uniref:lysozyme n=1 Tax=Nicrophorus vespilloides TaxID=110193 RepID=A0ABM1N4X0_NICVS|nr:PREDICTED: lysozyme C-like [Nicrophorus vespilloides]XP_017781870.1 PREDICTED: lysozyme C-like [Nicrophorus vespilloides]